MEPGKQEVDAEKGKHRDSEAKDDQGRHQLAGVFPDKAEMQIGGIGQPGDKSPGFLGVPSPPSAPGVFSPDCPKNQSARSKNRIADGNARIGQPVEFFPIVFGFSSQLENRGDQADGEENFPDKGKGGAIGEEARARKMMASMLRE